MMEFVLEMMDFVLKMMDFIPKYDGTAARSVLYINEDFLNRK